METLVTLLKMEICSQPAMLIQIVFTQLIASKLSQANQNLTKDNYGELKIDATVADQQIRYPNDLGLIAEVRVKTEAILDILFDTLREELSVKPRTYRKQAHKIYLSQAKKKKKTKRNSARLCVMD